jgi:hypothetical protein
MGIGYNLLGGEVENRDGGRAFPCRYPYVCVGSMSKPFRAGADPRFDHIGMR